MNRFTKVALHSLLLVVCVFSSPIVLSTFAPAPVEAAPRTSGKPGRLQPAGRRAVVPQDVIRADRIAH